jgi:flagellar basal-body rod protein FlgC
VDGELSALDISASALVAQRIRLNVVSENLANAETTRGPDGGPYRRKIAIFGAERAGTFDQALTAAVSTVAVPDIQESEEAPRAVYQPAHPDANPEGYVMMPNINSVLEMADLLAATRAYEANVTAVQAAKSMATKALEIGR